MINPVKQFEENLGLSYLGEHAIGAIRNSRSALLLSSYDMSNYSTF